MQRVKDIVHYVKRFVDTNSMRVSPFVATGQLNNEYIRGNQYKKINKKSLAIEDSTNPQPAIYLERKVFNRILPIFLTRYGILTENMPIPGFKATDESAKRVFDAAEGNRFIKNFLVDVEFEKIYHKAIKHGDIYGACWLKTGIDWSFGDPICNIELEITDNMNKETVDAIYNMREGRPFIDMIPMDEVFVDNLYAETADEVNELVHRRAFSLDYIQHRWGVQARAEDVSGLSMSRHPMYNNMAMNMGDGVEYAYVYEYYKRPDAVYPKGRFVMTINDTLVLDDILPYENAGPGRYRIPFDLVKLQSVPSYLYGVTVYQQLLPIQDTYNAIKNRYLEYMNHVAIGQMYYWEGSLINKNGLTTKPGKLIGLKRNARKPEPVEKSPVSGEFINYLRTLEEDMLIAAGLSTLSAYGMSKSNVRTDGVADKIGESDQNKLTNALDNIGVAIVSAFKKILFLEQHRQEILATRLALVNRDEYMIKYNVKDIDPNQITVVNRDFLMQSDQILDKKMMQASQLGLYNPEARLSFISKLEILNALHSNSLTDTLDPVERATHDLILEEHYDIKNNRVVPTAEEWHKHDQHIFEHNLYRISPEVRKLKTEDPELYQLMMEAISNHIDQHKKYGEKEQNQSIYQNAKAFK